MTHMLKKWQEFFFNPVRPLSTTAPIHIHFNDPSWKNWRAWKPFARQVLASTTQRQQYTHREINERIIEIPWLFNQLDFQRKGKVLDVGWLESTVSFSLATAGFEVTGIDIRADNTKYPHFKSVQADICDSSLKSNTFDYVILLSTLEHIGLDTIYGQAPAASSDQKAIAECLRVLKKGGRLLLTTPVSKTPIQNSFMRSYTVASLKKLLKDAKIVRAAYYAPTLQRRSWRTVTPAQLPQPPAFGVALLTIQKL